MPVLTTKLGLSTPVAADPNNVPADLLTLASRLDAVPGIEILTTTQRDALAAAQRWTGRVIWNATTARPEVWNGAAWVRVPVVPGVTLRLVHTWQIPGAVNVAVGDTDYIMPTVIAIPATQSAVIAKVWHAISSGTSATYKMQQGGADITGLTGLVATTSVGSATPSAPAAFTDAQSLAPVVTAVSGSPKNLRVHAAVDYSLV